MEFKAYHKIKQFKDVVRTIQHQANFKGLDESGEPIYEESLKPVIKFKGTVKLHGTNAGVCFHPDTGVVAQKRSSLLDKESVDAHMGFNNFVLHTEKRKFERWMETFWLAHCNAKEQITLYGEWAGQRIQKGVAISEFQKSFYIFDLKVFNFETEESRWIDVSNIFLPIDNVYNVHQFKTFEVDIDFNKPAEYQNMLAEITQEVEKECPIAKTLGKSGVGEGVVWTGFWNNEKFIFKVKGEKHSSSKVKTLAKVDPEKLNSINEFVEYACTKNRIEQGIQETGAKEKKDVPDLLRWVANDIVSEESDTLKDNNLEWKDVAKQAANKIRLYYFEKLDKL